MKSLRRTNHPPKAQDNASFGSKHIRLAHGSKSG
jgi:hypothetical protein